MGSCDLRKAAGGSSDVGTLGIVMDEQGTADELLHCDEADAEFRRMRLRAIWSFWRKSPIPTSA